MDPFGLELSLGTGRTRPYVAVSGGFRWFSSDVPNPRGTNFNLSADLGVGVQIDTGSIGTLILGVDLHHISNAGRGGANPSYNIFLLRLGYSVRR